MKEPALEAASQIKSYMMFQSVFDMVVIMSVVIVVYAIFSLVKQKLYR